MSWAEVDRCDPVSNDAGEFERLAQGWRTAADTARSLSLTFDGIVQDTSTVRFEGQTADVFQQIVADNAAVLKDVPDVCGDLASLLSRHASEMRALRSQADSALARARTAWNDKSRSHAAANQAHGRAELVRQQIRSLQGYPPEQVALPMERLRYNLSVEERTAANHEYDAQTATQRLQREYTNRDAYERDENALDKATANAIRHLDLRSLKDPNLLQQLSQRVADELAQFLADPLGYVDRKLEALERLAEKGLWLLRDALDLVGQILAIAMLVALVVPGLQFALGPLAAVAAVIAVAKAASTLVLVVIGSKNPSTGEQLGLVDLGVDALMAAVSVTGVSGAYKAGANLTRLGNSVAGQKLFIRQGIEAGEGFVLDTVVGWNASLARRFGPGEFGGSDAASRFIFGSSGDAPTSQANCVRRQAAAIESRNRGLSAPCRPVLVPCAVGGAR